MTASAERKQSDCRKLTSIRSLMHKVIYMKNLRVVPIKLIVNTCLFILTCASDGQTQSNNSRTEANELNSATPFNSLDETVSKLDKNIRSIFQDSKGQYWFGTNSAGVYRYDSKTLTQFTTKDGLADNQIINIQEDDLGNIWFGSGTFKISKFDGTKVAEISNEVKITRGTNADWKSKINDLWFYAGGGVIKLSNSLFEYLPFNSTSSIEESSDPFSLSRYGVYCTFKDKSGNVWFGTQAEGVCKFDGKTLTWFNEKGLAGPAVLGLFEDSKGNLWFGNNGAGLFRFDGKTCTNFTEEKGLNNTDFIATGNPGSGTMARVYSINEDNSGTIWVGTVDAGVWKFDGMNLTNYTTKDGLTSNAVNTIYKDKNGELWFGTDSDGICKFNGKTFFEFTIK